MNQQNVSANGKRVPLRHWLYLAGALILTLVLSSAYAGKSQGAEVGDMGYITANTHLCHTSVITEATISALDSWAALIKRVEAAFSAAENLSAEDNRLGWRLSQWCSTMSEGYPVGLFKVDGDHALIYWHESLGFGSYTMIIRLDDFHGGGLEL